MFQVGNILLMENN